MTEHNDRDAAAKSRLRSCALLGLGPVLLLVGLVIVFIVNNRPPNIHVPTPKMPKDNGWDYFLRAGKMLKGTGPMLPTHPSSAWTVVELERFARENGPALDVLREGLTKEYLLPPVRSFHAPSPGFVNSIGLAYALVGEAMYYQAIGQYARAASSRLDAIEFGMTLPRGGGLMASLEGSSVQEVGAAVPPMLDRLTPGELGRIGKRLDRIQGKRVPFWQIAREQGRSVVACLAEEFAERGKLASLQGPTSWFRESALGLGPSSARDAHGNARVGFLNKRAAVLDLQRYYESVAREQRKAYNGKSCVPVPNDPIAHLFLTEAPAPFRCRMEISAAVLTLIQTEVALRRYRFDHKRFPDRLSDLVPGYLKAVPTDPLGLRKPLRYRPLDGGKSFLLYSLGCDLKDDHGAPGSTSNSYQTGDIVAGQW